MTGSLVRARALDQDAHLAPAGQRCVLLLPQTHGAGAENLARYTLQGMRQDGEFDVELAYFNAGLAHSEFVDVGVPMRSIPRRPPPLLGRARRLRHAYREHPPDLLHTWLLWGNTVGLLAARAWPSTAVVISQLGSWNELAYPLYARAQSWLIGRADHAISNSSEGGRVLEQMGMASDRISVIPNGIPLERVRVNTDRESIRARHGWEAQEIVVWVGRANEPTVMAQKGFATLLRAIERLRDTHGSVRLAIVGITSDEITASGFQLPDWATAMGWVEHAPDYLNAADVVAISSRVEGDSNVAGEAMMLGVPVVTTECGEHCRVVRNTGGHVVPVGDATALADGLAAALERPPARSAVREKARDALSVERMLRETRSVYREVLARKGRNAAASG